MVVKPMVFGMFHGHDKIIILEKFMVFSCHTLHRLFVAMKNP